MTKHYAEFVFYVEDLKKIHSGCLGCSALIAFVLGDIPPTIAPDDAMVVF
jgi:hypothetical protein